MDGIGTLTARTPLSSSHEGVVVTLHAAAVLKRGKRN